MIGNYLKIAIRNIWKHKAYSFINIIGLAIGLAIFSLTAVFFQFHLSFNKFTKDVNRIYIIVQVIPSGTTYNDHSGFTRAPLRHLLLDEFPEIEDATRWINTNRTVVRQAEKKFYAEERSIWFVDSNFLTFFTFEMITGDPETALKEPNSAVLTESTARKYFGSINVVGQKLTIWKDLNLVVKGVSKDVPYNSSLKYDVLVSSNTFDWETNWNISGTTFVRFAEQADPTELEQKFPAFIENHLSNSPDFPQKMYLLPLTDLNLKSLDIWGLWRKQVPEIIYLTFAIGIILLLVVCFNFMNLATTQYLQRAKEVGVRKAMGASGNQLMWQFLGESILLALIAFPLAIVLNEIMYPLFAYLISSDPTLVGPYLRSNPLLIIELFGVTILVGIIAGSYPSLFLSRLEPVRIFRENLPTGKKGTRMRQTLIVLQMVAAIFSVLVTLVTFNQYNFLLKFDVGYEKDHVLLVKLGTNCSRDKLRPLKEDLSRHPDITYVSTAVWAPANWGSGRKVIPEGASEKKALTMNTYGIDYDFIELLDLQIVQGRSFSREFADSGNFIINKTAARKLNWEKPIGKKLSMSGKTGVVVGVAKDFYFKELLFSIWPTVLYLDSHYLNYLYIKLADAPVSRVLNFIENRWREFAQDMPFEYSMLNERFEKNLFGIMRWGAMAGMISIFAILFSCLGLFGLASDTTQRRTKEIGIRKAHGATMVNITRLILLDFSRLIILAMIITWPLFYIVDKIIVPDVFAYNAETGFGFYVLAGVLVLITGLVAVLTQTIKAARKNPIHSLRYE
jgi:putative ABC transport system permease protein